MKLMSNLSCAVLEDVIFGKVMTRNVVITIHWHLMCWVHSWGFIDREQWSLHLEKIDENIFNLSRKNNHRIFSILRKSFEFLFVEDQLLSWMLRFFYLDKLERLKTKSLLERLGDGVNISIGMHDLWRAFCVAETDRGEPGSRWWVYETNTLRSEVLQTSPIGTWQNVKRMAFLDSGSDMRSLERTNFAHFPNVAVLMLLRERTRELVLDLSGLKHLKSLEVRCWRPSGLVLHGLPRDLAFLSFENLNGNVLHHSSVDQLLEQIGRLQELQCLELIPYNGYKLPDMTKMVSLRVASLGGCYKADTLTGLSSKLTNLRVLDFRRCRNLRSCPGMGELVALEELNSSGCESLAELPNLRKLRNLRKLDVSRCPLLIQLPGLGDLVALEELYAQASTTLFLCGMWRSTSERW